MDESEQNLTPESAVTPVDPYKTEQFDAYVSYLALGGMTTTDDGQVRKIPLEQFAAAYGVSRTTLWTWKNHTPNMAELIRQRREEVVPLARESAGWNQLFLLGMQTQDKRAAVDALKTYLGHFSGLRLPSQEVKHEVGEGFSDLIAAHRRDQLQRESRIIDVTPSQK